MADSMKYKGTVYTIKDVPVSYLKRYKADPLKMWIKKKLWNDSNKAHLNQYNKKIYEENKEEIKERWREYYYNNKQALSIKAKTYRKNNKDKIKAYQEKYFPEYYAKNKKKIIDDACKWAINNKEKATVYKRKYLDKQMRKYPLFYRLRGNIKQGLHKYSNQRDKSLSKYNIFIGKIIEKLTEDAKKLGYKYTELMELNYHIDHIIPISLFNLNDEKDISGCWHYSNLRWLPAKDNISRGNKLSQKDIEIIKTLPTEIYPKSWGGIIPV